MTRLPTDAHELTGFEDYGVDQKGVHVFFGFQLKDAAAAVLHCNYKQLGQCIVYLQDIAQEAFRRRDPASAHQEVRETQSDFVRQLDFEVDVTGDEAALLCTTLDGHRIELQICTTFCRNCRLAFAPACRSGYSAGPAPAPSVF